MPSIYPIFSSIKLLNRIINQLPLSRPLKYWKDSYNVVLWQEGLLIDYLQKLSLNRFLTVVVNTSFALVMEKTFFEPLTRSILDLLIWPLTLLNPSHQTSLRYMFFVFTLITALITLFMVILHFSVMLAL